ncbi:hypothetical protein [Streptacidiphilus sp. EB129]|uniref:hypothetical protein n=1 Tax=Streptacidiphilus sp. EB129 TaxID=3156262 RepID=UPI00351835EA
MRRTALRGVWLVGTLLLTLGSLVGAVLLAPAGDATAPGPALGGLLFLGSSVHVASTGWFYTVPQVRRHLRASPGRYLVAPVALVAVMALLAAVVPQRPFALLLLAFFGWQFFHFQKQNLGLAALASSAYRCGPLRPGERRAITATGLAGTLGLLSHPALLQLTEAPRLGTLFPVAAGGYALAAGYGAVQWLRRPAPERPAAVSGIYLTALAFFLPVFLFTSPYAAVAGLTAAHGYQYLLIVGLVAGGAARRQRQEQIQVRLLSLAVLLNIGLFLGLGLNLASHLHTGTGPVRAVYGAYLGMVMAHFVVDAGLWRLRDEFPRRFLGERLPYLLGRQG